MHMKPKKTLNIALVAAIACTLAACYPPESTDPTSSALTSTSEPASQYPEGWTGTPTAQVEKQPVSKYPVKTFVDVSQSAKGSDAMIRALIPVIKDISPTEPEWLMLQGNNEIKPIDYVRVVSNIEKSGSYLDIMDLETDDNPIISSHIDQEAVNLFITDLETDNEIYLLANILKKSGCTGYSFHVVKSFYRGDVEYWKYDLIDGAEIKHAAVFDNLSLDRYCLVIACGKEENVLDFDARLAPRIQKEKNIVGYDNYHVFYGNDTEEYQIQMKATETPASTITGLKDHANWYTLGTASYEDKKTQFVNPNTFLFKSSPSNNIDKNSLQAVMYGVAEKEYPSQNPMIKDQKAYVWNGEKYEPTKEISVVSDVSISDGLKRIDDQAMNQANGGDFVSPENKTLVLKIEKQDMPKKKYAFEYTIGFPEKSIYENSDKMELYEWASKYSVDYLELDNIVVERNLQPNENSEDDEPHYTIKDPEDDEIAKLSKMVFFSTFAKEFNDAKTKHMTDMHINVLVDYE